MSEEDSLEDNRTRGSFVLGRDGELWNRKVDNKALLAKINLLRHSKMILMQY